MKNIISISVTIILVTLFAGAAENEDQLLQARSLMRDRDFAAAVETLDEILEESVEAADEALYLKGRALFLDDKFEESANVVVKLTADYPESDWYYKARFLHAQCLAERKDYKGAEKIYEAEAHRLLSAERKEGITRVIVSFADELAAEPAEDELDATPPNYNKAYSLYNRALQMEIDRDLKDELMFKKARAIQEAGNANAAVRDFHAYLDEFDPDWTGPTGSTELKAINPPPPGGCIVKARYRLARAEIDRGQRPQGRWQAEDLIRMLVQNDDEVAEKYLADSRWLVVRSYNMPNPPASHLDMAINASKTFLRHHPADPRGVKAAFDIPQAYQNHGRSDDAIKAYRDFIAGEGFQLPTDTATDDHPDLPKSPAELKEKWTQLALYRIGTIQFQQHDYEAAMESWRSYVTRYPNGANWAASQNGIVNAQFQQGVRALAEKEYAMARRAFQQFLREHPLDARARRILFAFGQIAAAEAEMAAEKERDEEEIHNLYRQAVDEWRKLVSKYPNTEESSLGLYKIGMIYEEELQDFEAALDAYRNLTWGSYASKARQRIQVMTQTNLRARTERIFRTDEIPRIRVNSRNIETLTVRLYRIDLEAYFRNIHSIGGVHSLDVSLIEPDKTWEETIEGYRDYMPYEQTIEIPFEDDTPGACVVSVTDEENWRATTLVLRSDLEIIVKSSRREALAFAQDRRENNPAKDVRVLLSDGTSVFATGETGKDGVYLESHDELKDLSDLRVLAVRDGHIAAHNLNLQGLGLSSGLVPKGYIYTDRHVYRPGETVSCRGILREVIDGEYAVPHNNDFDVSITDSQGRLLRQDPVALSRFGSFHLEVPLTDNTASGNYTIQATGQDADGKALTFNGTFQVQEFKLEKIRLSLDFPQSVYFRGESIKGEAKAEYYWGQPVADSAVRVTLPDGRVETKRTDDQGKIELSFDTTPMTPGSALSFQAQLKGENVTSTKVLRLARLGFTASVSSTEKLVLAGAPFDVTIKSIGADGEPVGKQMNLTVLRRETPKPDKVLDRIPWMAPPSQPAAEVTIQEYTITTDDETGTATQKINLETGGKYILRVAGQDRFEQTVTAQSTMTVSDEDDSTRLRLFADSAKLQVGEDARVRLHSRLDQGLALITYEGETILRYEITPINKGFNELRFEVGHDLFPNMRLAAAAIDGRALRTAGKDFTVERELRIQVGPRKDAYNPGEMGKVDLVVTDQLGRPVEAELSLALVDQALFDAFKDSRPNILEFFQKAARRQAEFRTGSSCGYEYDGHTEAVIKAVVAERDRQARETAEKDRLREMRRSEPALRMQGDLLMSPPQSRPGEELRRGSVAGGALQFSAEMESEDDEVMEDAEVRKYNEHANVAAFGRYGGTKQTTAVPEPRTEHPDAGYWIPSVITDKKGEATVDIPMPEKTTAWKLTSRGCTPETLVGQATANTVTRKDFFLTMKTPAFVRDGDELRVMGRVHSLRDDIRGEVQATLEVTAGVGGEIQVATRETMLELAENGVGEVAFRPVKVPDELNLKLTVTARAGDAADALLLELPVVPWGLEYADHDGGVSEVDVVSLLKLPDQPKCDRRWMTLSIGPDAQRSLVGMVLDDVPHVLTVAGNQEAGRMIVPPNPGYGGTPGSDLLATVSVLEYAQRVHIPPEDVAALKRRARGLVATLVTTQRKDGSWGSHPGPTQYDDWTVTARGYWALAKAHQLGVAVHAETLNKTRNYLNKHLSQAGAQAYENKAVMLHALSISGDADFAKVNRIYRERNSLGATALAYTALTFANLDREPVARELAELLLQKIKLTEVITEPAPLAHWAHESSAKRLKNNTLTTGLALLVLAQTMPDAEQGHAAARWLLQQRGSYPYRSGAVRGPVLAGLSTWFRDAQQERADFEVTIMVNNTELGTFASDDLARMKTVAVPENALVDGENRVEFRKKGRGTFLYAASLRGFSKEIKSPDSFSHPHLYSKRYYHEQLRYRGNPIGVNSSTKINQLEIGQRTRVVLNFRNHSFKGYMIIESPIPAGAMVVKDSVSGNHEYYENRGDRLVFYYRPNAYISDIHYQLVGYVPGTYRAMPVIIRDAMHPGRMRVAGGKTLTVLGPGEESDKGYTLNRQELYKLGTLTFNDGVFDKALEYLTELYNRDRDYNEKHLARMLLWILTTDKYYEAPRIVELFEVLRERYPELEIPFDKILVVGEAYRDIGEFERSWLIFRATIGASFISDSNVSAVLEDEGRFLHSVDYQEELWREYPDNSNVVSAYFALTQALYNKAPNAHKLPEEEGVQPNRLDMLERAANMLTDFLTLYPTDPLADDAAFSLANAFLDLENYSLVVKLSSRFAKRYSDSSLASSFRYMEALGYFWQAAYDKALGAAIQVANGESKDSEFAQYIVGQIHHAQGSPAEAIAWYSKVKNDYSDAAQAIEYFEDTEISMEEVTIMRPGEKVELPLKYRNIKEAFLQVYRVDLMKLYLREKNLSRISKIHLAGIDPALEKTVELGDGKDYVDKTLDVVLDLSEEGAYLVICRGDNLFTSGLVLITPLKIEMQIYEESGRIRANVLDAVEGGYRPNVHVKAIGSADEEFRSGDTDLRGIFVADNLRGKPTIIAREGESRYAFHRGETWVGQPQNQRSQPQTVKQEDPTDYQQNLRKYNDKIQNMNMQDFDRMRRIDQKGVQIKAAF